MNVCVLSHLNSLNLRGHPSFEILKYSTREACASTCKSRGSLVFSYYKNKNYNGKNYNECRCGAKGRDLNYMTKHEPTLHKGRTLGGALQRCNADDVSTLKWCTCSTALPLPCRFEKKCPCPAVTKSKRSTLHKSCRRVRDLVHTVRFFGAALGEQSPVRSVGRAHASGHGGRARTRPLGNIARPLGNTHAPVKVASEVCVYLRNSKRLRL